MSENLLTALQVGQRLCWNESIGYFLRGSVPGVNDGSLNPDVDCSYFVGYCLQQGGFNVSPSWYTGSMITTLRNYSGFTEHIYYPGMQLKNGDIFVWDDGTGGGSGGHTFFYCEYIYGYLDAYYGDATGTRKGILNQAKMEAAGTHGHGWPETGDQDNGHGAHTEVWIHNWDIPDMSKTWHVFRWHDTPGPVPPPTPPTPGPGNMPLWMLIKLVNNRENGG